MQFDDKKRICNIHKKLKTNIKPWINTKKVHRITQVNQKAWLKPFIKMNNKLRTDTKNDFEKKKIGYKI